VIGKRGAGASGHIIRACIAASAAAMLLLASTSMAALGRSEVESLIDLGYERAGSGDWIGAVEAFTRAIEMEPRAVGAYRGRCWVHAMTRSYQLALADCDRAIELGDGVASYVTRGNVYDDAGKFELALADYDRAIELDPTAATAYRNRGVAHHRQGANELAMADYDRAIALEPDYAAAFDGRGALKLDIGDLDGAAMDLERALELDPDAPGAYFHRGRLRQRSDDPVAAIQDYDAAIRLDPGYALAYADRALARIELGRYDAAIEDAERALELRPDIASAYHARALALAHLGQDDAAIADYDRAIELAPDFGAAIAGRARAHLRQGAAEAARQDAERLIELVPEASLFVAFRGAARAMAGDVTGAEADFDQARSMATGPDEVELIDAFRAELEPYFEPRPDQAASPMFDLAFPPDWELVGTPSGQFVLEARFFDADEPAWQVCGLSDVTEFAAQPPAWAELEDAEETFRLSYGDDESTLEIGATYLDLAAGRVLAVDSRWENGVDARAFVFQDGDRWMQLDCWTDGSAPEDRWRSIATTFVFTDEETAERSRDGGDAAS
jgi:tetratricopeptide (TPR) repeat protein